MRPKARNTTSFIIRQSGEVAHSKAINHIALGKSMKSGKFARRGKGKAAAHIRFIFFILIANIFVFTYRH